MSKVKRFLFPSSEAENGVEEKKKVCRSPAALSPTLSSEAESQDQKRTISMRSKSSFDGAPLANEKSDCKTESKNDSKVERKKSSSSSQYIFVSLLSRDSTYKLLKSVCGHLENTGIGNGPSPSSLENSFRADRPSSLPLDFNDEFSDLDGVVQQRRQDMEGYSSSGSQTPESENSRAGQSETIGLIPRVKSEKWPTLHHILIFYAIVVCALIISTFYMRYRINTLEEQLGSLTSSVDTHQTEQTAPSGLGSQVQLNVEALCQELTANIIRLEKIQSNLQKLLENGD
ncbi:hypothetical protein G4228_006157 [Cervus hanglu yarkandensis]|nr:hypothetical protein G4228_006157 [Cervus hanglu yarkandensis]